MVELLDGLRDTVAAQRSLDTVIAGQVRVCRDAGVSWAEIAEVTDVSKATAMSKWKDTIMSTPSLSAGAHEWTLVPGTRSKRREVHARYGGNIQSAIASSATSDNILLFAGPAGERFGYRDGENADGTWTYTGEGQVGDQTMTRGNRSILTSAETGKQLRLFVSEGNGYVTYVGQAEYLTHEVRTIPGTGTSGDRSGIVFTLRLA